MKPVQYEEARLTDREKSRDALRCRESQSWLDHVTCWLILKKKRVGAEDEEGGMNW